MEFFIIFNRPPFIHCKSRESCVIDRGSLQISHVVLCVGVVDLLCQTIEGKTKGISLIYII